MSISTISDPDNSSPNLLIEQDRFLQHLAEQNKQVAVFLRNGVKLTGFIDGFDRHTIFLRSILQKQDSLSHMIYKHAISTIAVDYVAMK